MAHDLHVDASDRRVFAGRHLSGKRALRNLALAYLAEGEIEGMLDLAREQLVASTSMTDAQGALSVIVNSAPLKAEALIQLARGASSRC